MMHKTVDASEHDPHPAPETTLEKEFVALDRNNDKQLSEEEIMYRQYSTGCEPVEAQVRGVDYMRCADTNGDAHISYPEFEESTKPAWAQCVKEASDRRAHGFVRFVPADTNYDGKLSMTELRVGILTLWGTPGEALVDPLMKCADTNKDGYLQQSEFHKSIAAYNPATRTWQSWDDVTDASVLTCMTAAFHDFDARLAFGAVDSNKDEKISRSEFYDTMRALKGPTIQQTAADGIFDGADKDKDKYLSLEEFTAAGSSGAAFFFTGQAEPAQEPKGWMKFGISVQCHARDGSEWRIFNEAMGRVQVTPTDDQGAVKVTVR